MEATREDDDLDWGSISGCDSSSRGNGRRLQQPPPIKAESSGGSFGEEEELAAGVPEKGATRKQGAWRSMLKGEKVDR